MPARAALDVLGITTDPEVIPWGTKQVKLPRSRLANKGGPLLADGAGCGGRRNKGRHPLLPSISFSPTGFQAAIALTRPGAACRPLRTALDAPHPDPGGGGGRLGAESASSLISSPTIWQSRQ